jgi:hypothetical protein
MTQSAKKSIKIQCPECESTIRIPADFQGKRGRCPQCNVSIDIQLLLSNKTSARIHTIPESTKSPLLALTQKYSSSLKQYGIDLQKIYELMRQRLLKRKEFKEQKTILRNQVFHPIIEELMLCKDISLSLEERIELWERVFGLLPYTYPDKTSGAVFNIYPRYEYACLIGLAHILSGYSNQEVKLQIIKKAIHGERTEPDMKALFARILKSPYRDEFVKRTKEFLESNRHITARSADKGERELRQIEEDFNFGTSWIAFHLPPESEK